MPWIILFLFLVPAYGQTIATTPDGRSVILKEDGTWIYQPAVEPGEFTFRQTYWGMSRAQVEATESGKTVDTGQDNAIAYQGKVASLDAYTIYYFVADKLVKTRYAIVEKHSNRNDYIEDYSVVQKALTDKYGTPKTKEVQWKNRLYQDDQEEYGFAVSLGHLQFWSSWETEPTDILLRLWGDNYQIKLMADYESKRLRPMLEAENKKESLSEF